MRFTFPVTRELKLELGSEIMLNAGRYDLDPFDQHRASLMAKFGAGGVNLSTGYMNWLILTPSGVLENRHSFILSANHSFDLSD